MATVKVTDLGLRDFIANAGKMGNKVVKVGIIGDAKHDGTSVLDIAFWNEFGASKIPARPFIGGFSAHAIDEIKTAMQRTAEYVDKGGSIDAALRNLGQWAEGEQRTYITTSSNFTPNAPYTIAKKGSSKPLIDTGFMLRQIAYKVE